MSGLGYVQVPRELVGEGKPWGTLPLLGPVERPKGWIEPPKPADIAEADVLTQWTCPFCDFDNEVAGEGAVDSWMECAQCLKHAWLVMS